MARIKIKCPSCGKAAAIDTDKLPDRAVRFACRGCSHKILIDKTKLGAAGQKSDAAPAPAPAAAPTPAADSGPIPAPAPATPAPVAPAPMPEAGNPFSNDDQQSPFANTQPEPAEDPMSKQHPAPSAAPIPEGAPSPLSSRQPGPDVAAIIESQTAIPSGIVIGSDQRIIQGLTSALRPRGCKLEHIAGAAVRTYVQEGLPKLIIFVAGELNGPPYEPLDPILALLPADRRETFVVLVSDNLRTLDGSAAFFYQVNMILSARDIAKAAAAIGTGIEYHEKLYRPFMVALAEKEGLAAG